MTSWVQPHQVIKGNMASMEAAVTAVRAADPAAGVVFVSNDDAAGEWAGSTTVARFLADPYKKWPAVVRMGVEGITAERRAAFGKTGIECQPHRDRPTTVRVAANVPVRLDDDRPGAAVADAGGILLVEAGGQHGTHLHGIHVQISGDCGLFGEGWDGNLQGFNCIDGQPRLGRSH